jgi:hypothetical protein
MGKDPLAGCFAKVERAEHHYDTLHSQIGAFMGKEPKPYGLVPEVQEDAGRNVWRLRIFEEPPLEWSTIVGDYVHNLRAALDHLIWVLVKANGFKPGRGHAFPIFDVEPPKDSGNGERRRWNRQVYGLHPNVVRFIELCQPYNRPDSPSLHRLYAVRTLSNEDKHRTLLPAFVAIKESEKALSLKSIEVRDIAPTVGGVTLYTGRPLEDGDIALHADIQVTGPNPYFKLDGEVALDVGFGRKPIPVKGLEQLSESVIGMLDYSRRFLGE